MFGFEDRAAWSAMAVLVVVAGAAGPGCGGRGAEPDVPDVAPLLAAYAEPHGTVDLAARPSWLDSAQAQLDLVNGGDGGIVLSGILSMTKRQIEATTIPDGPDAVIPTRADGLVTVDVACGDAPEKRASVVMRIVDGTIAPVSWGTARSCGFGGVGGGLASYDGTFVVFRYPTKGALVRVDGLLGGAVVGAAPTPISLDFRSNAGAIETRVTTSTGDVIVTRQGSHIVARAANGTFRCTMSEHACTAMPAMQRNTLPPPL